jgi:hypothetical protein
MGRLLALVLVFALAGGAARAQSMDVHGRLEAQEAGLFARGDSLEAALGAREANDLSGNLRLTWEPTWGSWSLQIHCVAAIEDGPQVRLARAGASLPPAPPETWFNLTDTFVDRGQVVGRQGIDRLALAYSAPGFVVRVGRQPLTWGAGLVFRPLDLIDPFSPSATDTEYKPGADMLYAQRLFTDGSDLQFVLAPRPARAGAGPSSNASTAALLLHKTLLGHETTWLLARDRGDVVLGAGVNGALGGATWNLELTPTFEDSGGTRVSALANISDAVSVFHHNATVFGEYFHNGFGVAGDDLAFSNLPRDLGQRLARGQLFSTRRDYLAGGLTIEVTPLITLSPTLIANLDDASLFALFAGTWSLSDNLNLVAGVQVPIGPARTEFGGLPISPTSSLSLAPPGRIYLQLRRYF